MPELEKKIILCFYINQYKTEVGHNLLYHSSSSLLKLPDRFQKGNLTLEFRTSATTKMAGYVT